MKLRNAARRLLAVSLSTVMGVALLPFGGASTDVEAAQEKKVASLNTDAIGFPVAPQANDTGWKGSYVWYGKYDGKPVKYRVLQPYSFDYGSKAMFLDCDTILFMDKYDEDGEPANASTTANGWDYSELRGKLNSAYFLDNPNNFTSAEKNALTVSRRESHPLVQGVNPYQVDSWTKQEFVNYVGLPHESVFLLDAEEVSNTAYGYPNSFLRHPARVKKYEGKDEEWVLRSASKNTDSVNTGLIGYLFPHGELDAGSVRATYGVSPAFNVNTNLVLFTSVVKGTAGAVGSEYKLTVIDKIMTAYAESNTMLSDGTISFKYCVNGEHFGNATQLSYLILDKKYTSSNQDGAKILYYGKMNTGSSAKLPQRGTASFKLPADLSYDGWNRSYFVYFFAEDVNGEHETDFASDPFELRTPAITADTNIVKATVKNSSIKKGGVQEFTVQTGYNVNSLTLYAESGNVVKTWQAEGNSRMMSNGSVRLWNLSLNINTAGNRTLTFKAKADSNGYPVSFTVEDTWVNEASAKYANIGKNGTQTFTVKTTSNAQNLMVYAEGGNLVKTWPASGNSTVSGSVRTWTVKLAINSAGNRELTFKAAKSTTPSSLGKSVRFTVAEKKVFSANPKYSAITKTSMQGFTVTTTADVKYLMMYAEGGNLVKSWPASGNSSVAENNIRTWYVMQPIGTAGNRRLIFKGGTTGTTVATNSATAAFKVVDSGVLTVSAKNATINKGTKQTFTVTTTADCNYLAEYAEGGNLVTTWTASSSNSTVSGNVRTWTLTQTINSAGNRTLKFKAGKNSAVTAAERNVNFTVK